MRAKVNYFGVRRVILVGMALLMAWSAWASADAAEGEREKLRALIVDGQNNHDWVSTTPVLKDILEATGLFAVEVATTPGAALMEGFKPEFADYDVIVLNYNGADWPGETQEAFVEYVRGGGGVVVYHAADNSFAGWKEFNEMIGLGGWGGRDEKSGPLVRFREGKVVFDTKPGQAGSHGPQHEFQVVMRDREHPITRGLPERWMHVKDELYSELRGPAKNMTLLATAYADPKMRGTGEHEPALFTISYGKGRIFHTTLGHDAISSRCVGFICTLQRGTEWAATGKVTLTKVPEDFPTEDGVSLREQVKRDEIWQYDFGDSRKRLAALEEEMRGAGPERLREIEGELLEVLKAAEGTYASKQFACRVLRRIGTERSAGVLAGLLADKELSHMARFALEGMGNAAAGAALREGLDQVSGDLKIGIISSLGAREEWQAIDKLAGLVNSEDRALAAAAISALGRIGGIEAAEVLYPFRSEKPRLERADAFLMCADGLFAEGHISEAQTCYSMMLREESPLVIQIAAYRGIIRCDQENAAATIISMLKAEEEAFQQAAGSFVAEARGKEATRELASALGLLSSGAKVILLNVLAERGDKAALGEVVKQVESEDEAVCEAALGALGVLGDVSSIEVLVEKAAVGGSMGAAALDSLNRLGGGGVDAAMMKLLQSSDVLTRFVLIRSLAVRGYTEAVPILLRLSRDSNVGIRRESLRALGALADETAITSLVELLIKASTEDDRREAERTIIAISNRLGEIEQFSKFIIEVLPKTSVSGQVSLLGFLGRFGGDEALEALIQASRDENEEVQGAAIRALAAWGDAAPAGILIEIARNTENETNHVLALRGYIRMAGLGMAGVGMRGVRMGGLRGRRVSIEDRQPMFEAALQAARRAEEKRMILGAVANMGNSWALQLVEPYRKDEEVKVEAEAAYEQILAALNTITARARNAEIHGTGLAYEGGRDRDCIGLWSNEEAWVSWEVEIERPGVYEVEVWQSVIGSEAGSEYEVRIGDKRLAGVVRNTGDWSNFVNVKLGEVEIDRPGKYAVAVVPTKKAKSNVMNLRSVMLRRLRD